MGTAGQGAQWGLLWDDQADQHAAGHHRDSARLRILQDGEQVAEALRKCFQ